MPGYPDIPPVSRSTDHRHGRYPSSRNDNGYAADDLYRRPSPRSRDPPHDEPRTARRQRRRDAYDASEDEDDDDDDDDDVPRRRHRDDRWSHRPKAYEASEAVHIPPPPIGDDRKEYASVRRHRGDEDSQLPYSTAPPVRDAEAADRDDWYAEQPEDRRTQRKSGRRACEAPAAVHRDDEDVRRGYRNNSGSGSGSPYADADAADAQPPARSAHRKARSVAEYDDAPLAQERRRRKSGRSPYDEPEVAPVGRTGSRRARDQHDEVYRPHRSHVRDPYDAHSPRRRDPYADSSRRREHRAAPVQHDSDDYEAPRRRREDRHKRRYEDGYGTDRPRRVVHDDAYERAYRTDGTRDARPHRRTAKRDDRRREAHRRDDPYADDYDDHRNSHGAKPRTGKHGFDVDGFMQKGQKNWQKVAPVAKPLLAQLANTYLNNGRPGGGVPH